MSVTAPVSMPKVVDSPAPAAARAKAQIGRSVCVCAHPPSPRHPYASPSPSPHLPAPVRCLSTPLSKVSPSLSKRNHLDTLDTSLRCLPPPCPRSPHLSLREITLTPWTPRSAVFHPLSKVSPSLSKRNHLDTLDTSLRCLPPPCPRSPHLSLREITLTPWTPRSAVFHPLVQGLPALSKRNHLDTLDTSLRCLPPPVQGLPISL